MEVYTGFKKVSWSKKEQPREAFSKRKRASSYKKLTPYEQVFKNQTSKKSKNFYIIIIFLCIGLVTLGLNYSITRFTAYHNNKSEELIKLKDQSNKNTYNFLMNSGKKRLISNNLVGAYSEFKLAQAIYPKDEMVNQLLIETLARLCNNSNFYCEELNKLLLDSL